MREQGLPSMVYWIW